MYCHWAGQGSESPNHDSPSHLGHLAALEIRVYLCPANPPNSSPDLVQRFYDTTTIDNDEGDSLVIYPVVSCSPQFMTILYETKNWVMISCSKEG